MNNNYLILGLVLFFGILYYCFSSSLSVTENFYNQAVTSGQDDMNSINTLAQLATKLMSGGNTVPGNLTIQGNTTVGGNLNVSGTYFANNAWIKSADGRQKLYFSGGGDTYFGTGDNYKWRTKRDTDGTDIMTLNGDNGKLYTWENMHARTNDPKLTTRIGGIWSHAGIYGENNSLEIGSKDNKVYVGPENNSIKTDLIVTGKLQILDPVQRKHQIAGHYYIRAHAYSTPLYYGFNMLWDDHNSKEAIRTKYNWDEASFHRSPLNFNQGNSNDANWCARSLAVFPGYKAKLYTWVGVGGAQLNAAGKTSYSYGEYKWTACGQGSGNTTSANNVLAIFVEYAENNEPVDIIGW